MIPLKGLVRQRTSLVANLSRKQYFYTANGFRPRPKSLTTIRNQRQSTSEAGDDESGHIATTPNEGILFFDNIFPLRLQWLAKIPFLNPDVILTKVLGRGDRPDLAFADPTGIVQRAIPKELPVKITSVIPRFREGGAFVKFEHDAAISVQDVEGTLSRYLKEHPIRPWFNPLHSISANLVRGKPWLEDLFRLPTARLKVEFLPTSPEASAADPTQEMLFSLFRRYGKISEITKQPSDSKVLPRYAYLDYSGLRAATVAKNTMHGFILVPEEGGGKSGTVLQLAYESKHAPNWFREWLINHPRIAIPIIVALLGAASIAVFDPIRTLFIRMKITHGFELSENKYIQWINSQFQRGYNIIRHRTSIPEDDGLKIIWDDRKSSIEQLRSWMIETADTFVVIQGPRGAGKREFIMDQALKDVPNKLVIDCKRIQEARGDSKTIAAAANEVGYKPVFTWMNSVSSMIDLAATATIGTKTGFSETVENQLGKILSNTATALKQVGLSQRKKDDPQSKMGDDEWLEAHPELRPVVVIDNFLHKNTEGSTNMAYEKLAEWAAVLTTQNIAHVIFLTTDVSFSKSLSKALPNQVFHQITLGDCTPEVAKKLVVRQLRSNVESAAPEEKQLTPAQIENDIDQLDGVIQVLGGRLTDLEFLARRIRAGESPGKAVTQIIDQSASEILKMYLLDSDRKWTPQQAWYLIKEIAGNEVLRYNEVLLHDLFKDGEATLQALEQAELITITSSNGRPSAIKAGRPVYQAAFENLTEDAVLKSRMDLAIFAQLIGNESKTIDKCETELQALAQLPGAPTELKPRIRYLLAKAAASQEKIQKYESQSGVLKKVIMSKY